VALTRPGYDPSNGLDGFAMMQPLRHPGLRIFTAAVAMLAAFSLVQAAPASAEVKKVMLLCSGKLCPIFLPELPKPIGWSVDQEASTANHVSVIVPTGYDYGSAEAVIYGRAFYNSDKSTIESRAETSNKNWLSRMKDAKIDRLADVKRQKGGPAFMVFRYHNPSNAQQASEMVAFGEDTDKEGNLFGVQIVLTTASDEALANNQGAFFTVLKNY
jgi:hypothetical protein